MNDPASLYGNCTLALRSTFEKWGVEIPASIPKFISYMSRMLEKMKYQNVKFYAQSTGKQVIEKL